MTNFNRLARHARDPNIVNGYETFSANEDWWPEDRVTSALRDVPASPLIVQDDNYYMDLLVRLGLVRRIDAVETEGNADV